MAEARVRRRLAAILAADVVGYSRLMHDDEVGTLTRLNALRTDVIDPATSEHNGRVVKTTGDGVLAEFASAVEATQCAMDIQGALATRNAGRPPDDRIELRIGINLGDIIVEGNDIFGDGVNVAARLESLCEAGEILVSGTIYDQIDGKIAAAVEDVGERTVKNIAKPVRIYRVTPQQSAAGGESPAPAGAGLALPEKTSIAVLPFENMSGDSEQEYFSDGITEDIITDLSKNLALFVIARNSSFAYKGKHLSLRQVSRDLGVRYVLEGSVRKAGGRVRITAQLIDGTDDSHVWAERYDGELDDIFDLQDRVSNEIVQALNVKLHATDAEGPIAAKHEPSVDVYEHLLRARQYFWRFTPEANAAAQAELKAALKKDPDYAAAVAVLAECHLQLWSQFWSDDSESSLKQAAAYARQALAMDGQLPEAHSSLANALLWQRQHDDAIAEIDRAVELNPNNARIRGLRSMILAWSGRAEEAVDDARFSLRLDPNGPATYLWYLGMALYHAAQYQAADEALRQCALLNPDFMPVYVWRAATFVRLGKLDQARRAVDELLRLNPKLSIGTMTSYVPMSDPDAMANLLDDVRQAGIPE